MINPVYLEMMMIEIKATRSEVAELKELIKELKELKTTAVKKVDKKKEDSV